MQPLTSTSPHGDTRWIVQAAVAEQLLGANGLRLAEWQQAGSLETVKTGPHRAVYRLSLASGCFYLKHYRVGDWKSVLQNVVRPPRAVLEWRAAQAVAAAGIATIETVAVGRRIRHGLTFDSFLACRAIENTESLDTFVTRRLRELAAKRRHVVRRSLAESLGRLVAALHRGRLIHRDLHAENILVRIEPDDSVRLWLIDLHAVAVCRRLTLRHIERNLALLNPALVHELTKVDRARFFCSYWRALQSVDIRTSNPPVPLAAARRTVSNRIAAYCRRDLIRVQRKRDHKWSRGNRRLIIADANNVRCRGLALLGHEQLLSIRDDPDSLLGIRPGERSRGTTQEQTKTMTLTCGNRRMECRAQVVDRPSTNRWRHVCGAYSAVRHAWEMGHACLRRNIPTPLPLAFVGTECGGMSRQYFLTENIPGAVRLDTFLQEAPAESDVRLRDSQLSQIAIRLAHELRHMHAEGLDYQSFAAASILVDGDHPGRRLWFVSPQNVRRRHCLRRRHVVEALTGLYESLHSCSGMRLTHCLRFLKRYLQERFSAEWKPTWQAVQLRAASPQQTDTREYPTTNQPSAIEQAPLSRSA